MAVESKSATPVAGPPPTTSSAAPAGMRDLFSIREFRLLWTGNFFWGIATWLQSTTLNWLTYQISNSGTVLGLVNIARTVPMMLAGPLVGVLADRLDRKRYMLGLAFVQFLTAFGFAAGVLLHQISMVHIYIFSILIGVYQMALFPLQAAAVFDLVPRRMAPNAVGLNSAAQNVSQVIGPSLAGFLISALGPEGNFFTQSAMYIGVTISIAFIVFPPRGAGTAKVLRESMWMNFKEGLRFAFNDKTIRLLLLIGLIQPVLIVPMLFGMMPIVAKQVFHVGAQGLGVMVSSYGFGGLLGALFVANLRKVERRGILQLGALAGVGVGFLAFSLSPNLWVGCPFLALAGFCSLVSSTANQTVLQLIAPQEMRGRMTSLNTINIGLAPIGTLVMGSLADVVGARWVEHVAGALVALFALSVLALSPRMRELRLSQLVQAPVGARS